MFVAAKHAIGFGYPHDFCDRRQYLHLVERQCARVSDQIDLGQRDFRADLAMNAKLDAGKALELTDQYSVLGRLGIGVGLENQDHRMRFSRKFR